MGIITGKPKRWQTETKYMLKIKSPAGWTSHRPEQTAGLTALWNHVQVKQYNKYNSTPNYNSYLAECVSSWGAVQR